MLKGHSWSLQPHALYSSVIKKIQPTLYLLYREPKERKELKEVSVKKAKL